MKLFTPIDEKARTSLQDAVSHHAIAVATLDAYRLAPADPGDAAAKKDWARHEADLVENVRIAGEVVDHWRQVVARLEAEAAERAKAAEIAAVKKEAAGSMADLVRKFAAVNVEQAARLKVIEEHRARAAAAGVEDAEALVRRGPPKMQRAITETVIAWFDPEGRRYGTNTKHDAEGRAVKATDRVQREVVDTIREEATFPGEMPTRFIDAMKLVDLAGRSLLP